MYISSINHIYIYICMYTQIQISVYVWIYTNLHEHWIMSSNTEL